MSDLQRFKRTVVDQVWKQLTARGMVGAMLMLRVPDKPVGLVNPATHNYIATVALSDFEMLTTPPFSVHKYLKARAQEVQAKYAAFVVQGHTIFGYNAKDELVEYFFCLALKNGTGQYQPPVQEIMDRSAYVKFKPTVSITFDYPIQGLPFMRPVSGTTKLFLYLEAGVEGYEVVNFWESGNEYRDQMADEVATRRLVADEIYERIGPQHQAVLPPHKDSEMLDLFTAAGN